MGGGWVGVRVGWGSSVRWRVQGWGAEVPRGVAPHEDDDDIT